MFFTNMYCCWDASALFHVGERRGEECTGDEVWGPSATRLPLDIANRNATRCFSLQPNGISQGMEQLCLVFIEAKPTQSMLEEQLLRRGHWTDLPGPRWKMEDLRELEDKKASEWVLACAAEMEESWEASRLRREDGIGQAGGYPSAIGQEGGQR